MGMYDTIQCYYPLPDIDVPGEGVEMQTKSFGGWMENYVLTAEGRLLHVIEEWVDVPEEQRSWYGDPFFETHYKSVGSKRGIEKGRVDTNYHGDVRALVCEDDSLAVYVIRMTEGLVSRIWKIQDE